MTCPIFTRSEESLPPLPRGAPHTRCAVEPIAGRPLAGHGHERETPRRRNAGPHPPNGPGCEGSYIRPLRRPSPRRPSCPPLPPPPPFLQPHSCRCVGRTPALQPRAHAPVAPPPTPTGKGERAAVDWGGGAAGTAKEGRLRGVGGGRGGGPIGRVRLLSHLTGRAGAAKSGSTATRPNSSRADHRCSTVHTSSTPPWAYPPQGGKRRGEEGGWHWCRAPRVGTDTEADADAFAVSSCGRVRRGFHCGGVQRGLQQPKTWSAAAL